MDRISNIKQLESYDKIWDLIVIGGGASGLGVALDGLSRGLSVVLVEKSDFAQGTSSRSTKLLHGGVRYLAQGDISLVWEALKERGLMMKNAPHVSREQIFIIPTYTLWDKLKYGLGLKMYDLMAGGSRIRRSYLISKEEIKAKLPTLNLKGLNGGVVYYDGQFDDSRMALNLAQTCVEMGGCILNYMQVSSLTKGENGIIDGVQVKDVIGQRNYTIKARAVINATGVFTDDILQMDKPGANRSILPSQGAHLVMDLSFLGGSDALMIPKTSDGRVLFGIPWHGKLVLGTTDTVMPNATAEPKALEQEIAFILETCADYLVKKPTRKDVLSVYAGLRPLAAPREDGKKSKEISRSHKVTVADSHLISIIGGKWTTFRKMGEDTIEAFGKLKNLSLASSKSETIRVHGFPNGTSGKGHMEIYGSDASAILAQIEKNPTLGERLHLKYPHTVAEVVWMVRNEMAQKVEDILARRMRILFLDAQAALAMAPAVAKVLRQELGRDEAWEQDQISDFKRLAQQYLID